MTSTANPIDASPQEQSEGRCSPSDLGFSKAVRVRRSADYRRIQGRGWRIRTRNLIVLYTPGRTSTSRFGLTVSRKVGNAVVRNRVKRWLRESIRHQRQILTGNPRDVVFIATPGAGSASLESISHQVRESLYRISRGERDGRSRQRNRSRRRQG